MTDDAELEELRRQKLAELREATETEPDGQPADAEEGSDPGPGTPAEPVYLADTDGFDAFVAGHDLVLVDFYADWCGPCKQLDPVVTRLAAETDAAVLKVDVDANPALAGAHNVRGVPTMVLFADGEVVERLVGFQGEAQLRSLLDRHG